MEEVSGRILRTEPRAVLLSIRFLARLLLVLIAGAERPRAAANLGGTGAHRCDLVFNSRGNRDLWVVEIFFLDVSRPSTRGGEPAKLAKIHRACRTDRRYG